MQKDPTVLIRIHPDRLETRTNLVGDRFRRIRLANLPIAAQQIEGEQIWNLRAVGKAPAPDPEDAPLANLPVKLGEETRFADTGLTSDPDHLTATAFDLPQEVTQNRELALAIDKRRHLRRCRARWPRRCADREQVQAAARNLGAFAVMGEELERGGTLLTHEKYAGMQSDDA